jgi:hypothetical protein
MRQASTQPHHEPPLYRKFRSNAVISRLAELEPSPRRLFAMTAIADSSTQAAPNTTPEYEVKVLLKPTAALGPNKELTSTVVSTFEGFDMPPRQDEYPVSQHDRQGHLYRRLDGPRSQI